MNLDWDDAEIRQVRFECGWLASGEVDSAAEIERAIGIAFPGFDFGSRDLMGLSKLEAATLVANQLPGEGAWCRVVLGDGVGTETGWADDGTNC